MRNFDTGATRDVDTNKLDFEGFLSPAVLERYAEYMHKNRVQADGNLRDSDNWQKGIPKEAYMKSMWRHFLDVWKAHRGLPTKDSLEDALAALMFNVMGYLYETIKGNQKKEAMPTSLEIKVRLAGKVPSKVIYDDLFKPFMEVAVPPGAILSPEWLATSLVRRTAADDGADFTNTARDTNMGAFTHRYGALAHDQEAIDAEEEESYCSNHGPSCPAHNFLKEDYQRRLQEAASQSSDNPALPCFI